MGLVDAPYLPESLRWLEAVGRIDDAERVVTDIENQVAAGGTLPRVITAPPAPVGRVKLGVLFRPPVIASHAARDRGQRGVSLSARTVSPRGSRHSLFARALASPARWPSMRSMTAAPSFGPLLGFFLADRIGRTTAIVAVAIGAAAIGAIYPFMTSR